MDFITRIEAREQGLKYYFIGDECSKGHIAERMVTSNACVECLEERNQKFLEENTDKVEKKINRRRETLETIEYVKGVIEFLRETSDPDSPESIKLQQMELSILPKSKEAAIYLDEKFFYTGKACSEKGHLSKRFVKTGGCVECFKEYSAWYKKAYREEYIAHSQNRRARIKEVGGTFNSSDIERMYLEQQALCTGCHGSLEVLGYHIDHIMPISKGGSNWPDNLQLLCPECNLEKKAKLPEEWEKIAVNKRRKRKKDG